ncbi:UNVERIFIED_CONTAM: hypothetical protein K2H54_045025 [Gekko kuhli]
MLAESVLIDIAYKDEICKSHKCQGLKGAGESDWQNQLTDANSNVHIKSEKHMAKKPQETGGMAIDKEVSPGSSAQKSPAEGFGDHSLLASQSAPLCIPRREPHCEKELDLYRSWSSQSLYQQYPDLYIGGDHIADHMCDSGCIMDQTDDEATIGPVLFSEDIRPGQSPLTEPSHKGKAVKLWAGDDVGERSITLHRHPLSNSVINNYMEKKFQELYKQFLDEKLTRCTSITHDLLSHIGLLGLQDPSRGNSCECSTPNLQISGLP